jgi:hypothetical protein
MSALLDSGIGKTTFLSPNLEVHNASSGFCARNQSSVEQ